MRGIGVLEDGFVFTEEELERGTPRFWWGPRKRAAYDRVLARRGMTRKDREDDEEESLSADDTDHDASSSVVVAGAAAEMVSETAEKKTETGGSWFGSWGDGSSDGGGSSDSGGSSSDSGGSSDSGSSSGE